MISIMMPLVIRFSVIPAVILYAAQFTIHAGMAMGATTENQQNYQNDLPIGDMSDSVTAKHMEAAESVRELLTSSEGFLAGEDTPVWVAYGPDDSKPVSYTKLKQGIVKEAMDYWRSDDFYGFTIAKSRRSIDDYINLKRWHSAVQSCLTLPKYENQEFVTKNVTKRSRPLPKVLYPSILVTMNYNRIAWPTDAMSQQKLIKERILYALAFWNGVDLQLRHLQNPKVRLRVAGIVIGRNKEAAPYFRDHSVEESMGPMLEYWRNLARNNKDFFSLTSYNSIAAMTDLDQTSSSLGTATIGPPCIYADADISGVIISDDNTFGGMQTAVHEMSHLLGEGGHDGDSAECPEKTSHILAASPTDDARTWSECSLKHISEKLRLSGWRCMNEPKEYHPPGKPIGIILPGKLMPASKLCQGRGWEDGNVCWEYVTCNKLYCSNNHWYSKCDEAGPMPDGTTCAHASVCLDGLCVSNTTLAFL